MKRFNIIQKSTGNILDHGDFATAEQGYAWFEPFIAKGRYGAIEQPELKELQDVLITPAVLDPETGEELEPAVYEQQEVVVRPYSPAEYTIEITDVTAITEAINQIADAKAYLTSTDYMAIREFEGGEPMPLAVKTERAAKRALINSLEGSLA